MKYLFYRLALGSSTSEATKNLPENYRYLLWKPSLSSIVPSGVPVIPFAIWWGMHQLHAFANRHYSLFLIYHGEKLVHRSGVFPRYFRFPFMKSPDLQIGDTWTMPEHRGKGLATFALMKIIESYAESERAVWYVVAEDNLPSIRVVEKAGFDLVGSGTKQKRLGLSLLGSYVIESDANLE